MTRGFPEVLDDFQTVARNPHSAANRVYDAAMRLPQTERGAENVRMADGIVRAAFAAHTWAESVESAAAGLRVAVEAQERAENGEGDTAPWLLAAEVNEASRALLHLLGETEA